MQADFAELATTADNALLVAGLAKAPLKLGLNVLTKSAEKRAASSLAKKSLVESSLRNHSAPSIGSSLGSGQPTIGRLGTSPIPAHIHELIDNVPETALHTHAASNVPDELLKSFDVKDIGPRDYIPLGSASGSQPKPLLLTYKPTSQTYEEILDLKGPARWRASEKYIRELYDPPGSQHFRVPAGGGITGKGGRIVDAPVATTNGGTLANEVKMYSQTRVVNGAERLQFVPLSSEIRQQIMKDVWLRENRLGHDPRWIFLDAPPSEELRSFLREHRIVTSIHGK